MKRFSAGVFNAGMFNAGMFNAGVFNAGMLSLSARMMGLGEAIPAPAASTWPDGANFSSASH